jgi:hypothetical protein
MILIFKSLIELIVLSLIISFEILIIHIENNYNNITNLYVIMFITSIGIFYLEILNIYYFFNERINETNDSIYFNFMLFLINKITLLCIVVIQFNLKIKCVTDICNIIISIIYLSIINITLNLVIFIYVLCYDEITVIPILENETRQMTEISVV